MNFSNYEEDKEKNLFDEINTDDDLNLKIYIDNEEMNKLMGRKVYRRIVYDY